MDGVYNRKLFAKKSDEARNKLRQMGGVQPMAPQGGGILASSPELMQAVAMRQPVVLPRSQAPAPMAQPMPAPMTQMLPPSQPIPNIAGIQQGSAPMAPAPRPAPRPMAPAPRPMAQKPGVAKFNEGGSALANHYMTPKLQSQLKKSTGMPFDKAFEFGQTAITTEDPAKLGLPKGADMAAPAKMLENPEAAAAEIIKDVVPEDQQTGDTKKDLVKAAVSTGIESVPAEAEIDQLNRAIFGAKLAGAISGSYVNPQTGQEIRPTLGARMSQAAVEGLAVERETAQRRAAQEAALAQARATAAGKDASKDGQWLSTANGKAFVTLWKEYSGGGTRGIDEVLVDLEAAAPGLVQQARAAGVIGGAETPRDGGGGQTPSATIRTEGSNVIQVNPDGTTTKVGTIDEEGTVRDLSGNVVKQG